MSAAACNAACSSELDNARIVVRRAAIADLAPAVRSLPKPIPSWSSDFSIANKAGLADFVPAVS